MLVTLMRTSRSKFPKRWHDYNGNLRHFVSRIDDAGRDVVVSRWWSSRKQMWRYATEYAAEVEAHIKVNKLRKQEELNPTTWRSPK